MNHARASVAVGRSLGKLVNLTFTSAEVDFVVDLEAPEVVTNRTKISARSPQDLQETGATMFLGTRLTSKRLR